MSANATWYSGDASSVYPNEKISFTTIGSHSNDYSQLPPASNMAASMGKMSGSKIVFSFFIVSFLIYGIVDFLTNHEENRCEMTYMYENPEYLVSSNFYSASFSPVARPDTWSVVRRLILGILTAGVLVSMSPDKLQTSIFPNFITRRVSVNYR